jgi:tryptophan 2,3-dioxygenase
LDLVDHILSLLQEYRCSVLSTPSPIEQDMYEQFPLYQVLAHYQMRGKHFVDKDILEELKMVFFAIRDYPVQALHTQLLQAFLEMSLDKYLNYYDYNSYTGAVFFKDLSIDVHLSFDEHSSISISHLILLLCDIALFECRTFLGEERRFPDQLTSPQNRRQRIINALKAIRAYKNLTDRLVFAREIDICLDLLQADAGIDIVLPDRAFASVANALEGIVEQIPAAMKTICFLTMQPVWTVHDEYMFIRVLQCFEIVFGIIIKGFQACQQLMQQRAFQDSASLMARLSTVFQCNPALFRVLTSMPKETFCSFRIYTEGASAIQSEQYKLIEALAAHPSSTRLNSAAFDSVPAVKARYARGELLSFQDLFAHFAEERGKSDFLELLRQMDYFDKQFVQWKKMHYNIAVKMLGSQTGTGYTQGTPYLRPNVETRLFPFLQEFVGV